MVDRLEKQYEGKVDFRRYNVTNAGPQSDLLQKLGGTGVPEFYFVNSDGTLAGKIVGPADESTFTQDLDALK